MTDDAELRRRAEQRADAKIGFRIHFTVYLLVNAFLAALNLLTSPQYLWFVWAALGWGVGVFAHGVAVYARLDGARERMVEAELKRLREGV